MFWIASLCLFGLLIIIVILINALNELRSITIELRHMKMFIQETNGNVVQLTNSVGKIWAYGGAWQAEKDEDEWGPKQRDRDPTDDA